VIDPATLAAICQRAQELADAAPRLTIEQAALLTCVFGRCSLQQGDTGEWQ
jgi:hypothetical protein